MPADALRTALSGPDALPAGLVALPEDHPWWKPLRPLGYQVSRWLNAMAALRARFEKRRLPAPLLDFLGDWLPGQTPAPPPADFRLLLSQRGQHLHVLSGPDAAVADPRWWALLRLPALRDFWIAELRASHYTHLLVTVPQAWCMDPAPLPPGSVIPGLDLAGWQGLPRWREQGRNFVIHRGDGETVPLSPRLAAEAWLSQVEAALTARDAVLAEETGAGGRLLARYDRRDNEIMLADAFASI